MNSDLPKDLQRWERVRKGGKWRFFLLNGMISWGGPMFIIMTFVFNRNPDRPLTPLLIGLSAVLWASGGLLFGVVVWSISERRYQKHLATRSKTDSA